MLPDSVLPQICNVRYKFLSASHLCPFPSFFFFQSSLVFIQLSNVSLDAIQLSFYCTPGTNKVPPILIPMAIQVCFVSQYELSLWFFLLMPDTETVAFA